jgi:uncharacterized phiE125 gp8 family phage protein
VTRFALALAPASEPVTLAEAKAHARIQHNRDDTAISALILAARQWAEQATGRALVSQSWTATLDVWPSAIEGEAFYRVPLSPAPITAVASVTLDGDAVDSASYALRGDELWVSTDIAGSEEELGGGIVIAFTSSTVAAHVLAAFKLAILMTVAYWYENREAVRTDGAYPAVVAMGADALLQPYKVLTL